MIRNVSITASLLEAHTGAVTHCRRGSGALPGPGSPSVPVWFAVSGVYSAGRTNFAYLAHTRAAMLLLQGDK